MYTDKDTCSSPTPDFYAFKYMVATIAREGRDCATVDLTGLFLQTKSEENSTLLLKLTGAVALLLVDQTRRNGGNTYRPRTGNG